MVQRWIEAKGVDGGGEADQVIVKSWVAPEMARSTVPARTVWNGPDHGPTLTITIIAYIAATMPNPPTARNAAEAIRWDSATGP